MPEYINSVNDSELARLRDMANLRALEQRLEAGNADAIAQRDERVVAGEDTERAATTAANIARQQLGGAAGRGAAALAGMEAAENARNQEYASALQRARERKDIFEQKGVDRRMNAFDTAAQGSTIEQMRRRDAAIAAQMRDLQKQRDALQQAIIDKVGPTSYGPGRSDPLKDQFAKQDAADAKRAADAREAELKAKGAETMYETNEPPSVSDSYTRDGPNPQASPTEGQGRVENSIPKVPGEPDEAYAEGGLVTSDGNLKDVYKGAGPHAGKAGDPVKNKRHYSKKAEEMFEDLNDGVNEKLIERYRRG